MDDDEAGRTHGPAAAIVLMDGDEKLLRS
jgi:hypothetical protein